MKNGIDTCVDRSWPQSQHQKASPNCNYLRSLLPHLTKTNRLGLPFAKSPTCTTLVLAGCSTPSLAVSSSVEAFALSMSLAKCHKSGANLLGKHRFAVGATLPPPFFFFFYFTRAHIRVIAFYGSHMN